MLKVMKIFINRHVIIGFDFDFYFLTYYTFCQTSPPKRKKKEKTLKSKI